MTGDDRAAAPTVEFVRAGWDDDAVVALRGEQQAEIAVRYGGPGAEPSDEHVDPDTMVVTVLGYIDGAPVACGAVRDMSGVPDLRGSGGVHPPATGEVKRVYVAAQWRGRGLSRGLMAHLERYAADAGIRELILECGTAQPEAIGLYLSLGYHPIPPYGRYAQSVRSRSFGKSLIAQVPDAGVAAC